MFNTRVTELFGIKYPIVQGALGGGLATPELVAAVSNAGGLGTITSLNYETADGLRAAIRKTKQLTTKPICVNVTLLPTMRHIPYEEYFHTSLDEGVRIFETSGRLPEPYIKHVKAAGAKFVHKVGSPRHAKAAERIGCDAVSVVCYESAGHPLPEDVAASVLIPIIVEHVKIPVIQAGGVADAHGFVAALALGAEGVMMGTRFAATKECGLHPKLKDWIIQLTESQTMLVHRTMNNNERVIRTPFTEMILAMEDKGAPLEQILPLIAGDKVRAAYETGDTSNAIITAGQTVGLIHEISSVKDIIDGIISGAGEIMTRLNAMRQG